MASIGDLVANLSVNSAPWVRGFKSAGGVATNFASSVTKSLASVGRVAAVGLAGGAAVAGVAIYAAGQSIARTAAIADEAARTGLSGGFLQRLGYAADQSGVSSETLTKSVAKMTLVIGEAKGGSETAAKSLRKIGLSVAELSSLSPEQQLAKIGDGLGAIPDVGIRAAAAVDIFGKAGAELGPMFAGGSAELMGLMNQASGLGIGMSDEDIAKASAADDAMSRMKSTVVALIDRVSVGLAPAFTLVADAVTSIVPVFSSLSESVMSGVSSIGETVGTTFDWIVGAVVKSMSVAEFAFTNFGAIVDYVLIEAHIGMLAFVGGVEHFFTTSMPAWLSWFGDNWRDVFMTAFDFASTVFINIGENIRNAWTAVIDFISGKSKGLEFVWTPLTEGFVSTIKKLPDIPERAITGLEAQLRADSKVMGDALGSGLSATIEKNLANVQGIRDTLADAGIVKPNGEVSEPSAKIKGTAGGFAGAMEQGSAAAYSAFVKAMGMGGDQKILKDQLAVEKQTLAAIKSNKPQPLKVVERLA